MNPLITIVGPTAVGDSLPLSMMYLPSGEALQPCGEFGTGDPMQTGLLAGMAKAFLPEAAKNVVWKYIEPSYKLKGKGQGRIIPFYAVYIVLRLAASAPARQFWRYRQGGIHDE